MNLLWKWKHRYRFVSYVHTEWLKRCVPRHIARLVFVVYVLIDHSHDVELGAELSGFTAKFWAFWPGHFIAELTVMFSLFAFYSCSEVLNAHFQMFLESRATEHHYATSTQTNCCNSRLKKRTPNHLVIVKPRWSTFSNSTLIINARNITLHIYNSILCLHKFVVLWTEEENTSDETVPNLFFYAHEYCVVGHVIAMALGKSVVTVKYMTATSGPFPKLWA